MTRSESNLRDKAKKAATRLLIIHGYNGFNFGLLASDIKTTRANLHYHFKNKQELVDEVIDDYVSDTTQKFQAIWLDEEKDFTSKIAETFRFNEVRFREFNGKGVYGRPWSLIARMRYDHEVLSERAIRTLREFTRDLFSCVASGVKICIQREHLQDLTPVNDVVLQIASVILSAGPITQDFGEIDTLKQLYNALNSTLMQAYGKLPHQPSTS